MDSPHTGPVMCKKYTCQCHDVIMWQWNVCSLVLQTYKLCIANYTRVLLCRRRLPVTRPGWIRTKPESDQTGPEPGPCLSIKTAFPGIGIPIIKMRRCPVLAVLAQFLSTSGIFIGFYTDEWCDCVLNTCSEFRITVYWPNWSLRDYAAQYRLSLCCALASWCGIFIEWNQRVSQLRIW